MIELETGNRVENEILQHKEEEIIGGKIEEKCNDTEEENDDEEHAHGNLGSNSKSEISNSTRNACRICLGDENEEETNPLISPCRCAGSMQYIHLNCLKKWFLL